MDAGLRLAGPRPGALRQGVGELTGRFTGERPVSQPVHLPRKHSPGRHVHVPLRARSERASHLPISTQRKGAGPAMEQAGPWLRKELASLGRENKGKVGKVTGCGMCPGGVMTSSSSRSSVPQASWVVRLQVPQSQASCFFGISCRTCSTAPNLCRPDWCKTAAGLQTHGARELRGTTSRCPRAPPSTPRPPCSFCNQGCAGL